MPPDAGMGHVSEQPELIRCRLGIIPRAAGALFDHLAGSPTMRRNGSSNLRAPIRYSTSFAQALPTLSSLPKANDEKAWQMKVTYVEVGVWSFSMESR